MFILIVFKQDFCLANGCIFLALLSLRISLVYGMEFAKQDGQNAILYSIDWYGCKINHSLHPYLYLVLAQ